jgi:hypothetical protein
MNWWRWWQDLLETKRKCGFLFLLQIPVFDLAQVNSSYSIERHSGSKA